MSSDDNELPLSWQISCFGGNPERTKIIKIITVIMKNCQLTSLKNTKQ